MIAYNKKVKNLRKLKFDLMKMKLVKTKINIVIEKAIKCQQFQCRKFVKCMQLVFRLLFCLCPVVRVLFACLYLSRMVITRPDLLAG